MKHPDEPDTEELVWLCDTCHHEEPVTNEDTADPASFYQLGDAEDCVHCRGEDPGLASVVRKDRAP